MKILIDALKKPGKAFNAILKFTALFLIRFYQLCVGPWLRPSCRFHPTCSVYATDAYKKHPFPRATIFVLRRLGQCHPLGNYGYDPVPEATEKGSTSWA